LSDTDDKDKSDLTRIEDLSEFLHDEDEDLSDLETYSEDEVPEEELMDQATDPDIDFPAEFKPGEDADEAREDSFNTSFESADDDNSDSFSEDNSDSFGEDNSDSFGEDNSDSFGEDSSDSFGEDNSDSFGEDNSDSFGEDNSDSFGEDNSVSFGEDNSDSFGEDDSSDSFGDEDSSDSFGEDDSSNSFGEDDSSDSFGDDQETSIEEVHANESPDDFTDDFSDNSNIDEEENELSQPENETAQFEPPLAPTPESPPEPESHSKKPESPKTPIEPLKDKEKFAGPENFNELQKFAKNISYGNMGHEGNPPFSIIIKDIKFKEDIDEIIAILHEYNILNEENAESAKESLSRGSMLLPRLGEYSAIHICHKLRKYDISILMGLTEEIHPPKSYESDDSGIVSKYTVYNTKSHHYNYNTDDLQLKDIVTSTTAQLEGFHIREYITIASEYIIIDAKTLSNANHLEAELKDSLPDYQQEKLNITEVRSENLKASQSHSIKDFFPTNEEELIKDENKSNLNDVYTSLLEKLKLKALKEKGNAIVGIHYNVTPVIKEESYYTETNYQVTCSGSIVWANKV
jgi:uncharacterized protein YbjQ (UPF0145 family)